MSNTGMALRRLKGQEGDDGNTSMMILPTGSASAFISKNTRGNAILVLS